jgi:hypothetical protein
MGHNISELLGKTVSSIQSNEDSVAFKMSDGTSYMMHHSQDCCEYVRVEEIDGDLQDLIDSPITQAEEVTNEDVYKNKPEFPDSFTWTFYKLATLKGYVTIRWLGESNGYYSESVDFVKL